MQQDTIAVSQAAVRAQHPSGLSAISLECCSRSPVSTQIVSPPPNKRNEENKLSHTTKHVDTHTPSIDTNTYNHTHTNTLIFMHTHTQTYTQKHANRHSSTHTNTHSHKHTHTHTHTRKTPGQQMRHYSGPSKRTQQQQQCHSSAGKHFFCHEQQSLCSQLPASPPRDISCISYLFTLFPVKGNRGITGQGLPREVGRT